MADDARSAHQFAAWVQPHLPAAARFASRLVPAADRDDVVQEVLVRAWQRWPTYDVERAIGRLSRRQRAAVDLYYFVDLDIATVAAVMGCAPGTVKATLHQARKRLHELMGDDDG